eukprot:COSAG02_NODE_7820_length_2834_cov_2.576600_3_plen_127_part_00
MGKCKTTFMHYCIGALRACLCMVGRASCLRDARRAGRAAPDRRRSNERTPASSQSMAASFPIGTPGQVWSDVEKEEWRATRTVQRSYKEEVIDQLQQLDAGVFELVQYLVRRTHLFWPFRARRSLS